MAPKLLLINGPNLNLLGTREPHIYGHTTLRDVETLAIAQASDAAASLSVYQSNHEGGIIDRIHAARTEGVAWIIINPGAYTHTSVAIRDALVGVNIPFVEVHVSNVHTREPFRHHSYFSDKAVASVVGLGTYGYTAAVGFCLMKEKEREEKEKEEAAAAAAAAEKAA